MLYTERVKSLRLDPLLVCRRPSCVTESSSSHSTHMKHNRSQSLVPYREHSENSNTLRLATSLTASGQSETHEAILSLRSRSVSLLCPAPSGPSHKSCVRSVVRTHKETPLVYETSGVFFWSSQTPRLRLGWNSRLFSRSFYG